MRVKVQLVICADGEGTDTIYEVAVLEKDCQRIEQLGLTLTEAKQLLPQLQQHVVAHQATAFVTMRSRVTSSGSRVIRIMGGLARRSVRGLSFTHLPIVCLATQQRRRSCGSTVAGL